MGIVDFNNEMEMYKYLKCYFLEQKFYNSLISLDYAREKHYGVKRKDGHPYIIHPMFVSYYGLQIGLNSDIYASVGLLHDVPEDCNDTLKDLDIDPQIKKSANLLNCNIYKDQILQNKMILLENSSYLSKQEEKRIIKHEALILYYNTLKDDEVAVMEKLVDRYHNLSTLSGTFNYEKTLHYLEETKEFIYPLIDYAVVHYPHRLPQIMILKYGIYSLVNSIQGTIKTLRQEGYFTLKRSYAS